MVRAIGILQRLKNLESAVFDGANVAEGIDEVPDGLPLISEMIQLATVQLTNAQVKALPTTPIDIIPAPGAGKQIVAWLGFCHQENVAPYTNFGMGISLSIGYKNSSNRLLSTNVPDLLLGAAADYNVQMADATGSGDLDAVVENQPVQLKFDNSGAGDLTGGNAGNSFNLRVYYGVIDV